MALHQAGMPCELWDEWSKLDPARYQEGVCPRKWISFNNPPSSPVTIGTLYWLAGSSPPEWAPDEIIDPDAYICEIPFWRLRKPSDLKYHYKWMLENAFMPGEIINMVIPGQDGKPNTKGAFRTREEWIQDDAYFERVSKMGWGLFVRINPVDGKGVGNENITAFRHMLIECDDDIPIQTQIDVLKELPVTALVYSGKKSVHAWVRIDAKDLQEYQQTARKVIEAVKKKLPVDEHTKNPSRLSRMPGVERRNGVCTAQAIITIGRNTDRASDWLNVQDGLPEIITGVNLSEKTLPPLAPEIISGVLRHGHKLMLAGPSKAGKSFALISLALSLACGSEWFGQPAKKSKVLYVNFEIDPQSCLHRFAHVAKEMNLPEYQPNLSIWNLRGYIHSQAGFLNAIKKRAEKLNPDVMIIDPIYILNDGDENKASDIKKLLNMLDIAMMSIGTLPSIAFSHHFPKGDITVRDAKDRPSGSGVFARHPDAICTLTPLKDEDYYKVEWILREFRSPHSSIWRWEYPLHRWVSNIDEPKQRKTKTRLSAEDKIQQALNEKPDATIDEIAEITGLSKRTIYRYRKKD